MADTRTTNDQTPGTITTSGIAPPMAQDINGVGIDPAIDDYYALPEDPFEANVDRIKRSEDRKAWGTLAIVAVALYLLTK